MHGFLEWTTFVFCAITIGHAWMLRRGDGLWFFGSLLTLGFVRENYVVLRDILYGYGDLLQLGAAPLLGSVIWAYLLYVAVCWSEEMTGESISRLRPSPRFLSYVAVFMISLAAFFEPFLNLVDMARWQEGTRTTLGIPWIACVGYPSLTVPFLLLWCRILRATPDPTRAWARGLWLLFTVPALGIAHAWLLALLKEHLGW